VGWHQLPALDVLCLFWMKIRGRTDESSSPKGSTMHLNRRLVAFSLAFLFWAVAATQPASAQVLAIGASNTSGTGVGRNHSGVMVSEAWPAQLEQLLHARGINVHVKNAGLAGDTTCNMLSRLDGELEPETKVVIIQPGGNDALAKGGCTSDRATNVAEMQRRLRARGIKSILLTRLGSIAGESNRGVDGQHFNKDGHSAIAAWLFPKVVASLR
jgi:acyl-CoA thioesterase-1